MDNPDVRAGCCGKRPDKTRGSSVQDMADLYPLLKELPQDDSWVLRFECSSCGQVWEEHLLPFMHADVHVVVKQGVTADLSDPPPPGPPPPPPAPEPLYVGEMRRDRWVFLACCAAGFLIGLATRPDVAEGALKRGNHMGLCLVSGAAAGFAINLFREFLKR